MWQSIVRNLRAGLVLWLFFSVVTGLVYPMLVTGVAQLFFPWRANGSLIKKDGRVIGSEWLGQSFTGAHYFWGRVSATQPFPYNGAASSGSNWGPSNAKLTDSIRARVLELSAYEHDKALRVPVDLVTASGSGLDPDISPWAALYQVPRIASARLVAPAGIRALVESLIQDRTWGVLGEPRVNILQLNLALDEQFPIKGALK